MLIIQKLLKRLTIFSKKLNKYTLDSKFLLVGTKIDIASNRRQISFREGVEKASTLGCNYIETSAFDGTNIDEAFFML